jgi:drug/metabolite transporter (DMT)-like permease
MNLPLKERLSFEWGIVWMLLSASCLSLSFLFLKVNLTYFDYAFLLFLRFFGPLLLLVLFATLWRVWKEHFAFKRLGLQLARSGCVLVAQYGIAFYITKNSLLNATVLLNASPLFIPLLERIFLKQRPGKSTIVGALLSFFGMLLVLHPDKSLFTAMSALGILAALGQAGSQVLYGLKPKSESLFGSLVILFSLTSVGSFLVLLLWQPETNLLAKIQLKESLQYVWVIVFSLLGMAAATLFNQLFRGLAYRCGRPSTLATFLYFSVFVSALLDWLIFKQTPTALTFIGSCLIILGGILKIVLRAHILKSKKK